MCQVQRLNVFLPAAAAVTPHNTACREEGKWTISSVKADLTWECISWHDCFSFTGQQQHFRPFFDTRFTGHLLELRRKSSDPFSAAAAAVANSQGRFQCFFKRHCNSYNLALTYWSLEHRIPFRFQKITPFRKCMCALRRTQLYAEDFCFQNEQNLISS